MSAGSTAGAQIPSAWSRSAIWANGGWTTGPGGTLSAPFERMPTMACRCSSRFLSDSGSMDG